MKQFSLAMLGLAWWLALALATIFAVVSTAAWWSGAA
jgi:hypothetical protein